MDKLKELLKENALIESEIEQVNRAEDGYQAQIEQILSTTTLDALDAGTTKRLGDLRLRAELAVRKRGQLESTRNGKSEQLKPACQLALADCERELITANALILARFEAAVRPFFTTAELAREFAESNLQLADALPSPATLYMQMRQVSQQEQAKGWLWIAQTLISLWESWAVTDLAKEAATQKP